MRMIFSNKPLIAKLHVTMIDKVTQIFFLHEKIKVNYQDLALNKTLSSKNTTLIKTNNKTNLVNLSK
jgi:hypothetical protein